VHLGLAFKMRDAQTESAPIGTDRMPQAIIAVENGSKSEWQHSALAETDTYHFGATDETVAAVVFNGTYFVIAGFFNVLWRHAVRGGLLDSATQESAAAISRQYAVGPISYLICLGLTWISVPASLILNIALAFFFALPPKERSTRDRA